MLLRDEDDETVRCIARYDNNCPSCSGPIEVGDDIYLVEGEWLCEFCA